MTTHQGRDSASPGRRRSSGASPQALPLVSLRTRRCSSLQTGLRFGFSPTSRETQSLSSEMTAQCAKLLTHRVDFDRENHALKLRAFGSRIQTNSFQDFHLACLPRHAAQRTAAELLHQLARLGSSKLGAQRRSGVS